MRSRYGLFLPGSLSVPRCSRTSSAVRSQTYALPVLDQLNRPVVELLEVVGGVEQPIFPIAAEPADVVDDRIDVLLLFLGGVGVVEPQVELAAVLLGEAEVQADALGVADVQIAVRLGRKPRVHAAAVLAGGAIGVDDLLDEVPRRGFFLGGGG